MYEKTSPGLIQLIKRHGLKPTGCSWRDIIIAKGFMSKPYNKERKTNEKIN